MRFSRLCLLTIILAVVWAHRGEDGPAEGETIQDYAQRHMASEHHIDSFDLPSFFQLHDLDRDGFWDREEIEAIYGVHHVYAQKKSKDEEEHQQKANHIVGAVLDRLDTDKDGKVSLREFEAVGLQGLPNFESMGAEGHHYDVESEFFLHHEEEFHSTPETQTDEAYSHPEDVEHFASHDTIEWEEAQKEAKFQGIPVEELLAQRQEAPPPPPPPEQPANPRNDQMLNELPHDDQQPPEPAAPASTGPKVTRPQLEQDPKIKYSKVAQEKASQPEWGTGEKGYKAPRSAGERLRKNLPYKYKFKRNWGDF